MNETQQLIDWRTAFPAMGECESAEWMNEAVEAMKQQQQEIERLRTALNWLYSGLDDYWLATCGATPPDEAVEFMTQQDQKIATLRSRINTAPVAIMDTRKALGLCAPTEAAFEDLCALQGHRVALIDLGVEK